MPRRFALAASLALTVIVAFAVASMASNAGWLKTQPGEPDEVAVAEAASQPANFPERSAIEPMVITEYVFEDVPIVLPSRQTVEAPAPAPPANVLAVETPAPSGGQVIAESTTQQQVSSRGDDDGQAGWHEEDDDDDRRHGGDDDDDWEDGNHDDDHGEHEDDD
jgi:hypothetical protein